MLDRAEPKPGRGFTLLAVLVLASLPAAARPGIEDYRRASQRFVALVAEVEAEVAPQDRTARLKAHPELERLLPVLTDRKRFLDAPRYTRKDMRTVDALCRLVDDTQMALMRFDVAARVDADTSIPIEKQQSAVYDANILAFEDLFERMTPFQFHCMGIYTRILEDQLGDEDLLRLEPARIAGFHKMQRAVAIIFAASLNTAHKDEASVAYRRGNLESLAEQAPSLALALPRSTRATLVGLAERARGRTPKSFAPAIERIIDAMLLSPCGALCSL